MNSGETWLRNDTNLIKIPTDQSWFPTEVRQLIASHEEGCKGKERDILSSFTSYLHCEAFLSAKVLIFLFVLSQVTATWLCQTPWEVTHLMFFCAWVSHGSLSQRLGMHLLRSAVMDYLCHVFSSWDPWLLPFLSFIWTAGSWTKKLDVSLYLSISFFWGRQYPWKCSYSAGFACQCAASKFEFSFSMVFFILFSRVNVLFQGFGAENVLVSKLC